MAEVYRNIRGRKVTNIIALHADVQEALDTSVEIAAYKAEAELIKHRAQGHAFIEVEEGDVDRYLVLSDELGLEAALTIEFGRQTQFIDANGEERGAMAGLFILHDALGVPRRRTPESRGGDAFK